MNPKKIETVANLQENLKNPDILIFFSFSGISGQEITGFRKKMRRTGGKVQIAKNSLLDLAFKDSCLPENTEMVSGPTGFLSYSGEDESSFLKTVREFQKEKEDRFVVRGGFQKGKTLTSEQIFRAAGLPGRDHARAVLCGVLTTPLNRLLLTLQAVPRQFVSVLSQISEKNSDNTDKN